MFIAAGCADKQPAETAEGFVTRVMETSISGWDAYALYAISSEQFQAAATQDDVRKMFTHYAVLGKLKGFKPPQGQIVHEKLEDGTTAEVGAYQVAAEFENDNVTVGVVTIRTDTGWALYGFKINSNYVMSLMEAAKNSLKETHEESAE
jgi:hypothetical protein